MVDWTQFTPDTPTVVPTAPVPGAVLPEAPPRATTDWSLFAPDEPAAAAPAAHVPAWMADPNSPLNKASMRTFIPPAPEPSSFVGDVAKSAGTGLVKGTAELAMSPVTMMRMGQEGVNWLGDKADTVVRAALGAPPLPEGELARRDAMGGIPTPNSVADAGVDAVRSNLDAALHKPETNTGRYTEKVGEFVPALANSLSAARSVPQVLARLFGGAVLPGVASQAAGDLAEGTGYEGPAQIAGALLGAAPAAAMKTFMPAADKALLDAHANTTPAEFDAAHQLMLRSRDPNRAVLPLSSTEALGASTQGASGGSRLMRTVEASSLDKNTLARFFSPRPQQMQTAATRLQDSIAPAGSDPLQIGINASTAAKDAIQGTTDDINAATRPLYQAADPQTVPYSVRKQLVNEPGFKAGARLAQNTPDLGVKGAPIFSAKSLDKTADLIRSRAQNPVPGSASDALLASKYEGTAGKVRDATRGAIPEYDAAVGQQQQLRTDHLDPLNRGPVGEIAAAAPEGFAPNGANATKSAISALLPDSPLSGGTQAAYADAAQRIGDTAAPLVRQYLGDKLNKVQERVQTGGAVNQAAPVNFANEIAGNPTQEANLRNVVDAVTRGPGIGHNSAGVSAATQNLGDLIENFRATGHRLQPGSPTAASNFVKQGTEQVPMSVLRTLNPMGVVRNFMSKNDDKLSRYYLGNSMQQIGDVMSDPNGVRLIQKIVEKAGGTPYRDAALRTIIQSLGGM